MPSATRVLTGHFRSCLFTSKNPRKNAEFTPRNLTLPLFAEGQTSRKNPTTFLDLANIIIIIHPTPLYGTLLSDIESAAPGERERVSGNVVRESDL